MSKRGSEINYYKGHSRSRGSRGDDSDRPRDVGRGGSRRKRSRSRSRSRERRRRYSSPSSCSSSSSSDRETASLSKQHIQTDQPDTNVREMSISPHEDVDETPSPPPPPRISKISIDFNKPTSAPKPIQMSLVAPAGKSNPLTKPSIKPGSVFGDGSDEEPEEMPAEARMRMRNIGRDTPTSVGPNSFGKTKHGFCNPRGIVLKNLKEEADPPRPSLKATIYKL